MLRGDGSRVERQRDGEGVESLAEFDLLLLEKVVLYLNGIMSFSEMEQGKTKEEIPSVRASWACLSFGS